MTRWIDRALVALILAASMAAAALILVTPTLSLDVGLVYKAF